MEKIAQKGFCVIKYAADDDLLKAAINDVRKLERSDRFEIPPVEVVEGLLGSTGSTLTCDLDMAGSDGENQGLLKADQLLTAVGSSIAPLSPISLGFLPDGRTPATIHVADAHPAQGEPTVLHEEAADQWMAVFTRHRIMLILFMGPSDATLELTPFRHDDAESVQVSAEPGTIVALRADALVHKVTADKKSLMLTTFLYCETLEGPQSDLIDESSVPVARSLWQWCEDRMRQLKDIETMTDDGPTWDPTVPRHWQAQMNRLYHKGPQAAARSFSCKWPASWDAVPFWNSTLQGADLAVEIPFHRWKYEDMYDPDLDSYKWGKSCSKHGTFFEGIHLFDPKPFSISIFESKGMDPCQRHILESSYEALNAAGFKKGKLMKSLIGVYIGTQVPAEFINAPVAADLGGSGTSAAGAITSNRISFCLGMQGPSFTVDGHGSAGLQTVALGVNSIRFQTELYQPNHTALCGGIAMSLAPQYYILNSAAGYLNPEGRCFTFDASSRGFVKGEGVGCVVIDKLMEVIDGKEVVQDGKDNLGTFAGIAFNHSGQSTSLRAPHGPQERSCIEAALRQAACSPNDVDAVECCGDGGILMDAVETLTLTAAYRQDPDGMPLMLSSIKSGYGFQFEAAGVAQLQRVLLAQRYNVASPSIHLFELSPHIEVSDGEPILIMSEAQPFRYGSSFVGITAKGIGGSMVHCIPLGFVDTEARPPRKRLEADAICFWPGGGGQIADSEMPFRSYNIVGSWSEFAEAHEMEAEDDGVFSFTMTLGINRFEHFQIWMDGRDNRVFHPGVWNAPKNTAIQGPDNLEVCEAFYWMIDKREWLIPQSGVGQAAIENGRPTEGAVLSGHPQYIQNPYFGIGIPGEKYRIRLYVSGKWRTLDWEKVEDSKGYTDDGSYYIVGSWTRWNCTEAMKTSTSGVYTQQVVLEFGRIFFQVVRNKDWNQTFFPSMDTASFAEDIPVEGPDWGQERNMWCIEGNIGDKFEIEFQRSLDAGVDKKKVSWKRISGPD